MKGLQICDHGLKVVWGQWIRRHLRSRLNALRIDDPACERARRIGQRLGCNHVAAGDMSKVGTHARTSIRATNRVAHQTGMSEKNFAPANGFRGRGFSRGLQLLLLPCLKLIDGLRNDRKSHMRMLQPAELGALAVISSRPYRSGTRKPTNIQAASRVCR